MAAPEFTAEVYQNEYLPEGGREVHAIVSVAATGTAAREVPAGAEIIIVDCSGSMQGERFARAKEATAAAIDELRDGVAFAVIAGTAEAAMIWPWHEGLVPADDASRTGAKSALKRLRPGGGTAIGQWLLLAERVFAGHPATLRHAILLTDGKDEHETPEQLAEVLRTCEGRFTCDCRGVGTDWVVSELRTVASTLLGSVDIVADPAGLADDFRAMMATAMDKAVADVALRLWTPQSSTISYLKQVAPTIEDLTGRRTEAGPRTGDYPTGTWGNESRDYHLCVEVVPGAVGDEMLAGRVSLVADGEVLTQGLVRAIWTDDAQLSTKIAPKVAHYTGQAELADAIQQGLDAYKAGDHDTATVRLRKALQLAQESGHAETAQRLAEVVEMDPKTGTVRLKKLTARDEMELDVRSTKTVPLRKT